MNDAFVVEEGNQQCFDLGFLQKTFLVAEKSVNTTPTIAVLIPVPTSSTRLQRRPSLASIPDATTTLETPLHPSLSSAVSVTATKTTEGGS